MSSFWSKMRSRNKIAPETTERFGMQEWAEMWNTYGAQGLSTMRTRGGYASEAVGNDFCGYVEGAYKASGVVFACQVARMSIFSEVRFMYRQEKDGRPGDLVDDPDLEIFRKPWPNGSTGEMLERAIQDVDFAGNHYMLREGDRLRRLRPDWVDIILTAPPDEAVASDVLGYLYRPGGTANKEKWVLYPVDGSMGEVAHWSPIPDPVAQYRGMSWLTPVVREIQSDKAATRHKSNFFENAATPALAVSLDAAVTPEQFNEFMEKMDANHQGVENAGKTLYLGGGADVTVIGANMQQMDFKSVQGAIETRIAAAARVHPVIVGLSEGLQGSSLNDGNFRAAKENFGSATLRPLWRSLCDSYSVLVSEFSDKRLWYDDRQIDFLRQDRKEEAEVRARDAETISKLVMNGFEPDMVVKAVVENDLRELKHTGLYSVQLWPPESGPGAQASAQPDSPAAAASKANAGKKDPGDNGSSANDVDDKTGKEKKQ
jgi:phage portal protein BeeE